MDEVVGRSSLLAAEGQDVRLPVAHMVCNQTPPVGDKPSLMTFRYQPLLASMLHYLVGAQAYCMDVLFLMSLFFWIISCGFFSKRTG